MQLVTSGKRKLISFTNSVVLHYLSDYLQKHIGMIKLGNSGDASCSPRFLQLSQDRKKREQFIFLDHSALLFGSMIAIFISLLFNNDEVVGAEWVDFNLPKLPGADAILEQDVKVSISETLGLRKSEISPNYTQQIQASPEECGLAAPVPSSRVHKSWLQGADHNTGDVVYVTCENDCLDSKACGWQFGNEGIADRPDG